MRFITFLSSCLLIIQLTGNAIAQVDSLGCAKSITATRTHDAIVIDGVIDEPAWEETSPATGFTQYEQYNGSGATQKTEVLVIFDDIALYVGARLFDSSPDSIYRELGARDNSDRLKSDAFSVYLSTYNDGVNYLKFVVSASGVQSDIKMVSDGQERTWNAVWETEVVITDWGWSVEMKIPFSALRFSKDGGSDWGINFERLIKRRNERSTWSFVDKSKDGFTIQSGVLRGIVGVEPPLRISLTPYVSACSNVVPPNNKPDFNINGGLDLKLGLSESFTLDMTLIPDFGQVKSDEKVLNITPFEVQYDEARQFFTEGTELFSKGEIFYSRRIGAKPIKYDDVDFALNPNEVIDENPVETKMINATKLSGRTSGGLGVGFFNAMTQKSNAILLDTINGTVRKVETQGFTNYSMFVVDQSLANNSYISLANTNLSRNGYVANVAATEFVLRNKKNSYKIKGIGSYSLVNDSSSEHGYRATLNAYKTSGNFQAKVWSDIMSRQFNPNDMGYLQNANMLKAGAGVSYHIYKPWWSLLQLDASFNYSLERLYSPNVFASQVFALEVDFVNRRQLTGIVSLNYTTKGFDYFEPRVDGLKLSTPSKFYVQWYGSPDYRRWLAVDHKIAYWKTDKTNLSNMYGYEYQIAPRIRFSDKLLLVLGWNKIVDFNNVGHYSHSDSHVVMGKRDVSTNISTVDMQYTISSKMFVNVVARHYNRNLKYKSFFALEQNGSISPIALTDFQNMRYNIFNLDVSYSWNFTPGSELVAMVKCVSELSDVALNDSYVRNFEDVVNNPMFNVFSLKILYYIDYQTIRKNVFHKK